jgi:hypothetical protein
MSRAAQFAVVFAVAAAVLTAVHMYLWLRFVRDTALVPAWRQAATVCLVALAVSMPLIMGLDRVLPFSIARCLSVVPFVWMGAMVLFVFWFAAADVLKVVAYVASKMSGDGSVLSPAKITVLHNGILVQNNFILKGDTPYIGQPSYHKHSACPIKLQAHGDPSEPISYRNIWVRPL